MKRKALKWLAAGSAVTLLTVPVLAQQPPPSAGNQARPLLDDASPPGNAKPMQPGIEQPGTSITPGQHSSQPLPKPATDVTFRAGQKADEMLATGIQGTPVQNLKGEILGQIKDVVIGKDGKISTVIVNTGGFMGIGGKHVGIPYDGLQFSAGDQNGQHVAFLSTSKDALQNAPGYKTLEDTAVEAKKAPGKSSELNK
jgi:sporulation protein YlmC with PRC-barrel domain